MPVKRNWEAAERFYVLVHHLGKRLRALDGEVGLSPVRFSVLGALTFHPPMTLSELARFEHVRLPSMSRLVGDLEAEGLVERRIDNDDRRRTLVRITRRGRRAVERARNRKIELFARYLAEQPPDAVTSLEATSHLLQPLAEEHARMAAARA